MAKLSKIIGLVLILFLLIAFFSFKHTSPMKKNTTKQLSYVALGDSVSAGLGLQNYSDSSACDRTNQSYPNLVSADLNLKLTNLSCSSASLSTGIIGQQDVNNLLLSPQINQLFKLPKPNLISLTIGANDIGWTKIITQCYVSSCGSSLDNSLIVSKLSAMVINLTTVFQDIKNNYKPAIPKVIVTGYYQVFPSNLLSCNNLTKINQAELNWVRQEEQALNSAIKNVTLNYSFAKFANINYSGHELCTTNSWVQGLNDAAPFHPNFQGQQAYAKQIELTYKLFK